MGAMKVWDGTTWQTVAPFSERASVFVGPDQPAGATYAGDLWWDTDDPAPSMPGQELAYNQITADVVITNTSSTAPTLAIEGTSRTYDGSPIMVEFYCPGVIASSSQCLIALWDGSTDLGYIANINFGAFVGNLGTPVYARRRLTPTAGTHNYRAMSWVTANSTSLRANVGAGASVASPAFIRVTRV